jgi:hypothetical protein
MNIPGEIQGIHGMNGDGSDTLVDRLFREEQLKVTPADPTFVGALVVHVAQADMEDQCLICLQEFKEGDRFLTLPCQGGHKFHCGHKNGEESEGDESCPGISPWFQANHRCPICRHEFPKGEAYVPTPSPDQGSLDEVAAGPGPVPHPLLDFASLLELVYPNQGHPLQEHANPEQAGQEQGGPVPLIIPRIMMHAMAAMAPDPVMSEEEQMQRAIEESLGMS